jgi:hypothetical protein
VSGRSVRPSVTAGCRSLATFGRDLTYVLRLSHVRWRFAGGRLVTLWDRPRGHRMTVETQGHWYAWGHSVGRSACPGQSEVSSDEATREMGIIC